MAGFVPVTYLAIDQCIANFGYGQSAMMIPSSMALDEDISVEDAVASGRQYYWKVPATAQRGDRAFIYHYPDKEFVAKGHLLSDPRIKHGHRLASVGGLAPLTQPVSLQSVRARVRWRFLKSPRRAAQVPPEFVAGIIGTLDRPLAQEI